MSLTKKLLPHKREEQRQRQAKLLKQVIADLNLEPVFLPEIVYDRDGIVSDKQGKAIKGEEIWAIPPQVAIQVLNWRATHEFGITHEYEENILAGHVRQGHLDPVSPLRPRAGQIRNGYYRLDELMKLPLQPKKAVKIAATKRRQREEEEEEEL